MAAIDFSPLLKHIVMNAEIGLVIAIGAALAVAIIAQTSVGVVLRQFLMDRHAAHQTKLQEIAFQRRFEREKKNRSYREWKDRNYRRHRN